MVTTTSPYHLVNLENSDPTRKDETQYYDVMNTETEFTKDAEYLIGQMGRETSTPKEAYRDKLNKIISGQQ